MCWSHKKVVLYASALGDFTSLEMKDKTEDSVRAKQITKSTITPELKQILTLEVVDQLFLEHMDHC